MLYWIVPVDIIFTVRRSDESVNTSLCIVEAYTPFPIVAVQWYPFVETPNNAIEWEI